MVDGGNGARAASVFCTGLTLVVIGAEAGDGRLMAVLLLVLTRGVGSFCGWCPMLKGAGFGFTLDGLRSLIFRADSRLAISCWALRRASSCAFRLAASCWALRRASSCAFRLAASCWALRRASS